MRHSLQLLIVPVCTGRKATEFMSHSNEYRGSPVPAVGTCKLRSTISSEQLLVIGPEPDELPLH